MCGASSVLLDVATSLVRENLPACRMERNRTQLRHRWERDQGGRLTQRDAPSQPPLTAPLERRNSRGQDIEAQDPHPSNLGRKALEWLRGSALKHRVAPTPTALGSPEAEQQHLRAWRGESGIRAAASEHVREFLPIQRRCARRRFSARSICLSQTEDVFNNRVVRSRQGRSQGSVPTGGVSAPNPSRPVPSRTSAPVLLLLRCNVGLQGDIICRRNSGGSRPKRSVSGQRSYTDLLSTHF